MMQKQISTAWRTLPVGLRRQALLHRDRRIKSGGRLCREEELLRGGTPVSRSAQHVCSNPSGRASASGNRARVRLGRAILRQRRYSEAENESRAGYELLMKQINAPANWLNKARTDLEEEYDALKKPEQAGKFRAELPGSSKKLANLARKM